MEPGERRLWSYLSASFSTSHLLVQGKVSGSYRTLRAAGPSPDAIAILARSLGQSDVG